MPSGNLCVVGPRGSGKTTYLAALAYHQKHRQGKKVFKVKPTNPDSRKLADKADNILCQGDAFDPSRLGDGKSTVDDLPYFSFDIEVQKSWSSPVEKFQLTARDYPGGIFEKIAEMEQAEPIYKTFIDECFMDTLGVLILFTAWEPGSDQFYNRVLKKFLQLMDHYNRSEDLKLAVVMSKCERGEIWPGRLEPETDLFAVHLPRTHETLREGVRRHNLGFFALSTFGVLGAHNPRPNREDRMSTYESISVLRDVDRWQPYNLVEPLYWLGRPVRRLSNRN